MSSITPLNLPLERGEKMQNAIIAEYNDLMLDLVFPQFCLGCGEEGKLLCRKCNDKLIIRPEKICPVCKAADEPKNCSGSPLDGLWTLSHYKDYLAAESVQKIKYEFFTDLVQTHWNKHLNIFWQKFKNGINEKSVLIPVPLHRKRYLERGFNQSELIARELAVIAGLAVCRGLLKRKIYNEPQVGLSGIRRRENISGIFGVDYRALSDCWDRDIILIDDVYTTGSTMSECAKVLKTAGFKRVNGLVLAVD